MIPFVRNVQNRHIQRQEVGWGEGETAEDVGFLFRAMELPWNKTAQTAACTVNVLKIDDSHTSNWVS